MKMKMKTGLALIVAMSMHSFANAQDVRAASEGVVACQSIVDPMEKLACFEAAATQVSEALAEPEPTPVAAVPIAPKPDASTSIATRTAGVTEAPAQRRLLPSWIPGISDGTKENRDPDVFETTVTRIQRNRFGRHFFITAEGNVWRQVEVDDIDAPKALPARITMKRGAFGSIRLRFPDVSNRYYAVVSSE